MALIAQLVELIDIEENLGNTDTHLFDVRTFTNGLSGSEAFQNGHIKSAKFLDIELHLSDHQAADPLLGRHPLPSPEAFEATMAAFGVAKHHFLIFYDDMANAIASRAWWMASALGYDAALLNGAFGAAPKELLESGDPDIPVIPQLKADTNYSSWDTEFVIWEDELKDKIESGSAIILDARTKDRFQGINETMDPIGGHIPTSFSAFWKHNVDQNNRFKPKVEITENFEHLGILSDSPYEIISYCGSGVTACHNIFSLLYATGKLARLYPPSFSGWCQTSTNGIDTDSSQRVYLEYLPKNR